MRERRARVLPKHVEAAEKPMPKFRQNAETPSAPPARLAEFRWNISSSCEVLRKYTLGYFGNVTNFQTFRHWRTFRSLRNILAEHVVEFQRDSAQPKFFVIGRNFSFCLPKTRLNTTPVLINQLVWPLTLEIQAKLMLGNVFRSIFNLIAFAYFRSRFRVLTSISPFQACWITLN